MEAGSSMRFGSRNQHESTINRIAELGRPRFEFSMIVDGELEFRIKVSSLKKRGEVDGRNHAKTTKLLVAGELSPSGVCFSCIRGDCVRDPVLAFVPPVIGCPSNHSSRAFIKQSAMTTMETRHS